MPTVRYTVVNSEIIAENRGGIRHEYVPDPLGSTCALLDNTQSQTDTFEYWPFGEESGRTGSTATPFRYVGTTGYYHDSSTRSYVRARYMDCFVGRWVTEDPIGFEYEDWNLYLYAYNNPSTLNDPSGKSTYIQPVIDCLLKSPPNCAKYISSGKRGGFLKCMLACLGEVGFDALCPDLVCWYFPHLCGKWVYPNPCDAKKMDPNSCFDCQTCADVTYYCCLAKGKKAEDLGKCKKEHDKAYLACPPGSGSGGYAR